MDIWLPLKRPLVCGIVMYDARRPCTCSENLVKSRINSSNTNQGNDYGAAMQCAFLLPRITSYCSFISVGISQGYFLSFSGCHLQNGYFFVV
ncbi:hypothetical protein I7I50_04394 [Histoplasma capsulatum G186AR]|uniref:Uncharacterized protein n=1 Tax=Ajellomyces capsulatus TaxID=5037 RepID=A0A8H7YPI0_AJECA|nr:hypothetical protein I7I52_05302 [Histoplasma capsulatum]QSS75295.1 hypothetical protein I7I50_04394 [Histoplasma capsulatum G186AR]